MAQYHVTSLYVTSRWAAKTTSTWAGEIAMTGHRIGFVAVPDAVPGLDTGAKTLVDTLVNDASVAATTTHFHKAQNWAGDGASAANITDGDQDGIVEALWTFWNAIKANLSVEYTLQDIRLYALQASGRMAASAPCIYTPISALNGGATDSLPPQAAAVISTRAAGVGKHTRGRFYVGPLGKATLGTNGTFSSSVTGTTAGAILAETKTLYTAWRSIGGTTSTGYYPMVHQPGSPTGYVIRDLRAGDETDTQQRRRRSRPEVYTTLSL